jgi:hypothetical protein
MIFAIAQICGVEILLCEPMFIDYYNKYEK